ncbi:inhibitor of the pro-sigma K processing machinery [Clostridium sp. USBA 49]|jgi:inhibitor of the pro-sigma K processing machinery|uniref:pro-sigmaK processing inhibitor BofA family protein n=1 Tax=Clostridium sp. USBA 49 TaxID=1881060 RepID=UPI000999B632|nr:pro-sigmaK processing inhibitor BofA family protein [Clostridium sp. USBA 49]SKA90824.1 inhibitor of the pro-sigma K processing machinery [Clostridium sp. USBA 49]
MEYMGYFIIAVIAIFLIIKIFSWPIKLFFKLLANTILGVIMLFAVNFIGAYFKFYIGINLVTALIAGLLGVPGVIFLIIFKLFL